MISFVVVEISAVKFCSYFTHFFIMPKQTKKQRRSQSGHATQKCKQGCRANMWRKELEFFSDLQDEIKNPNGRSQTLEENKFLLNTYMYAESYSIISPCVLHIQNFLHNHSEHHAIHSTGCTAKKELLDF